MDDGIGKVYTPQVIAEVPFPQEEAVTSKDSQPTSGTEGNKTYSPRETNDYSFPVPRIAQELISTSLNTKSKKIIKEFQFTESGALQIGKLTPGVSGDIRISPAGITARNSQGDTTFSLDGETGDAVFAGTIQAGTLISGRVVVGDNTWIIDGNPDAPRILLYDRGIPVILIGRKAV